MSLYEPDPNFHPEDDPDFVFGDEAPEDTVDAEDDGYEPEGPDTKGKDLVRGHKQFLWAEA